jgi:hypothetical protein
MSDAPDRKSTDLHNNYAQNERNPPTPSEFIVWLRQWWDAPREKSKAADWALVALTVLIAVAAFWSAWIFQGQLSQAREATRLVERQWNEQQRAWVGPSGEFRMIRPPRFEAYKLKKLMPMVTVEFSVDLKNWGASPATSEDDAFLLFVHENGGSPLESFRTMSCKINEQTLTNVFGHRAIFPGQPVSITNKTSAVVTFSEITAVSIVGCITYRDVRNQLHHTKLWWTAVLPTRPKQELAIIEPRTTWVPFTKFRLVDSAVD